VPGQPLTAWTPGALLANYRQIQFGGYIFPLTFQEVDRNIKQVFDRRKLGMNFGEYIDPQVSVAGRDIEIQGDLGSLVYGSGGNQLLTDIDLENERALLAGLQNLGKQPLWVRPDRYLNATFSEFDHKFMDGTSFRAATWDCKFIADDPRYYATTQTVQTMGPFTDNSAHAITVAHVGNTKAFPTITITGAGASPLIQIAKPGAAVTVTFANLTMVAGSSLVVKTDPRPESRNSCAVYTSQLGVASNALQYIVPSTGFANNWDARQFFPYIESNLYGGNSNQQFTVQMKSGTANYTVSFAYQDTWL
jgi:hypothetical protein